MRTSSAPLLGLLVFGLLQAGCNGSGSSGQEKGAADAVKHYSGVLGKHCSACHAPPSPKLHSKGEWPSVVARMEIHRVEARMPALTDHERQQVLAYLQSHAPE